MLPGKLGQITKASGTNDRTGGTFVPLVTQLKSSTENSNITNFKISQNSRIFTNFKTVTFKIHKIQIIFIAAKFQQTLRRKHSA